MLSWTDSLEGSHRKTLQVLGGAGVVSVGDLLMWLPRRHEDRRHAGPFPCDATDGAITVHARVADMRNLRFGRRGIVELTLEPADGAAGMASELTARWFNMSFMGRVFAVGQQLVLYGKVKVAGKRLVMDHPEYELMDESDIDGGRRDVHFRRWVPVYPLVSGLAQKPLRELVFETLDGLDVATVPRVWPQWMVATGEVGSGVERARLLRDVHFPEDVEERDAARIELAKEELFIQQLAVVARRRAIAAQIGGSHCGRGVLLKRLAGSLPFPLTEAQKRCIREIRADLKAERPMHRLLQGDVGSGKTLVALAAVVLAIEGGHQCALMAPTQILAEQHFRTCQRILGPMGIRSALVSRERILKSHEGGEGCEDVQLVIGTQALLFDGANPILGSPGLVVIDEQHKFGVAQRAKLVSRGVRPDVLVMTATPIPRTLAMTLYGDLDVSVIDEMPPGRGRLVTGIRVAPKVPEIVSFLKEQLQAGRQIYLVHPLVEESEVRSGTAATSALAVWRKRLSAYKVGLLTGRTPSEEKEQTMEQFRSGDIHVLVATSVVEVGVDVANATVMVVHDAQCFGLAQLHQLRGRVGRGRHTSYCVLLLDKKNAGARERLGVLEDTRDGFQIAEEDLRQRGPGDVLGTAQSGLPALSASTLACMGDLRLLLSARQLAGQLLEKDPTLQQADHQHLYPYAFSGEEGFAHVG